ncbi:oligosaccharide flippase family protein [Clostridium gasigenes]|uniref:oligosaccharide flippase family protein n=1 Tax=Clostridium gasigenes TaxID=94869 RepID=UPI001C0C9FB4|nr:oligosaccharide flippase family protein [Clostridium gasigenes]MBU3088280.1 oligosaccharide flippase family protein [Clostridium gasigenes]
MNKVNENFIVKSAIWYTVGTFLLKGINFFTIPIFVRILSPGDYGVTAIYATWNGIFSVFIGLGINGTIGSAKANLQDEDYEEYLTSTLFLGTISFFIVLFIGIIFKDILVKLMGMNFGILIILIIHSFFSFVINFMCAKYTFEKDYKMYLKVSFIVTIINVLVSILLTILISNNKYIGKIYGGAIATSIVGIILYIKIISKSKQLINIKHWKFCLPMAIPLIFHGLSSMILNQADRVMLQKITNDLTVGVYSFTYNIGIILNIVNMAVNSSWVAWYFEAMKEKKIKEISKNAKVYIIVFTTITGMFIMGSPEVIKFLGPREYWSGIGLLPIIILGYYFVFLYTFSVNYEFYMKKTNYIAIGTLVAACVNIAVNMILIPVIGMYGAAIATLVAYIILFIMHEIIVRKIFKHNDFKFSYYIYSIIAICCVTFVFYILINAFIIRWSLIVLSVLVIGIYSYKKYIK